jgi:hypothetical protein
MINGMIACGLQRQERELLVCALCLLQTHHIRFGRFQPWKEPVLPLPKRIDIPGNDFHSVEGAVMGQGNCRAAMLAATHQKRRPAMAALQSTRGPIEDLCPISQQTHTTGHNSISFPGSGTMISVCGSA